MSANLPAGGKEGRREREGEVERFEARHVVKEGFSASFLSFSPPSFSKEPGLTQGFPPLLQSVLVLPAFSRTFSALSNRRRHSKRKEGGSSADPERSLASSR